MVRGNFTNPSIVLCGIMATSPSVLAATGLAKQLRLLTFCRRQSLGSGPAIPVPD